MNKKEEVSTVYLLAELGVVIFLVYAFLSPGIFGGGTDGAVVCKGISLIASLHFGLKLVKDVIEKSKER